MVDTRQQEYRRFLEPRFLWGMLSDSDTRTRPVLLIFFVFQLYPWSDTFEVFESFGFYFLGWRV